MKQLFLFMSVLFLQILVFGQGIKLTGEKLDSSGKIIFAMPAYRLEATVVNERTFLKAFYQHLPQLEAKRERTVRDDNFVHNYYSFSIHGIPIAGADYVVHSKDGFLVMANGNVPELPKRNNLQPLIDESVAKNRLVQILKAEYRQKDDTSFAIRNKGLVWLFSRGTTTLAYKLEVIGLKVLLSGNYYVSASDGKILSFETFILESGGDRKPLPNALGVAQTLYSGAQNFTTDNFGGSFRLRQIRNGVNILTLNANSQINPEVIVTNATDFTDNDNNWQAAEHGNDRCATDVHWGSENIVSTGNLFIIGIVLIIMA